MVYGSIATITYILQHFLEEQRALPRSLRLNTIIFDARLIAAFLKPATKKGGVLTYAGAQGDLLGS